MGDGTVEFAGTQSGYGNIVIVKHRNNQQTAYAHLSRIDVKVGQSLSQGQTVGAVGSTGWATGPHLHFEFRVNGEYQDPTTIAQAGWRRADHRGGAAGLRAPFALPRAPSWRRPSPSSRPAQTEAFSLLSAAWLKNSSSA